MSLNELPSELTAWIISYLAELETTNPSPPARSKTTISHYASTSINIRQAVESRTFSSLRTTTDDLPTFERLVTRRPSRHTLLHNLTFRPVLPAYSEKDYARYERRADRRRNDEAFSASLERLFAALKPLDEVHGAAPLRLLLVEPHSPTDPIYRNNRIMKAGYDPSLVVEGDLSNARFEHSYLHITESAKFQVLNRISRFDVVLGRILMAPGPMLLLLAHMPRVGELDLALYDNAKTKPGLREQMRTDFGKALSSSRCPALKSLGLEYMFEEPLDHRFIATDTQVSLKKKKKNEHDAFSLGLHRFISSLCPSLVRVSLKSPICIDETLFWPPESCSDGGGRWPSLKHFHVDVSCFRPDGGWYLDEHPGFPREEPSRQYHVDSDSDDDSILSDSAEEAMPSGDDEDSAPPDTRHEYKEALRTGDAYIHFFRTEPTEALERVWVAAARAASVMPKLRSMSVSMSVSQCPRTEDQSEEFSFFYGAGDHRNTTGSTACFPRLDWTAPKGWRMSEELQTRWRKVLGPDDEVTYEYW